MATGRNASTVLVAVISATILFVVFWAICRLGSLQHHGYTIDVGWQTPPPSKIEGVCDRLLTSSGFPLTEHRPANDPSGCQNESNPLAQGVNIAICFAAASILAVAIANVTHKRYG